MMSPTGIDSGTVPSMGIKLLFFLGFKVTYLTFGQNIETTTKVWVNDKNY